MIGENIKRLLKKGWQGDIYGEGRENERGQIWMLWIVEKLKWRKMMKVIIWRLRKKGMKDGKGINI